jgi:hypothetical protein
MQVATLLHWLSCLFWRLSRVEGSIHYASKPWHTADDGAWYVRTLYWAAVAFCSRDAVIMEGPAAALEAVPLWEYWMGGVQTVVLELAYVYFAANFTAIMLRFFQRLESYRTNMNAVDGYLQRNHVSRKLRALVRAHFKQVFEGSGMTDEALLRQMPFTLGREVMKEKNMRVIRRSPGFVGLDSAALRMLSASIRQVTFHHGEVICTQGDVLNELLILESGLVRHKIAPPEPEDEGEEGEEGEEGDEAARPVHGLGALPGLQGGGSRPTNAAKASGHVAGSVRGSERGGDRMSDRMSDLDRRSDLDRSELGSQADLA